MDVRLYELKTGKLMAVHGEVIDNTQNSSGDVTASCLDGHHRKAYVADSKGGLAVFNIRTGVRLATLAPPRDPAQMATLA